MLLLLLFATRTRYLPLRVAMVTIKVGNFRGWKNEPGETSQKALIREIKEELRLILRLAIL